MPQKNYNYIFNFFLVILVGMYLTNFFGCKKEAEKPEVKPEQKTEMATTPAETTKVVEKPKVVYPDLVGKWTGLMSQHATVINITEQKDGDFKGKISTSFRDPINEEFSGTLNIETKEISMKDLLHQRYQGTYKAKLSEDGKKITGTLTVNVDGQKLNFSVIKK